MKKSNREVYVGCWKNNQRNGWGKVYGSLGKLIQNGEFLNGCLLLRNRRSSWNYDQIKRDLRVLSLYLRNMIWMGMERVIFLCLQKFYCLFFLIKLKFNKIVKIHNGFPPYWWKFFHFCPHFYLCLIPNIHIFHNFSHNFFLRNFMSF